MGKKFIGREVSSISEDIKDNINFKSIETSLYAKKTTAYKKIINRIHINLVARHSLKKCMETSEALWTTSMFTTCIVGKQAANYKTVLQLMKLAENGYIFRRHLKIPIKKYAKSKWKTVVPEINRAYIQKIWRDLDKTPVVLPNKPFSLDLVDKLKWEYNVAYLGGFNPPTHLSLVQYSRIGLLPYNSMYSSDYSCLNALYCAPNKIWEYAGFGVPMVGSEVLGLKFPFEQWNIDHCCNLNNEASIIKVIEDVDRNHAEISKNCYKFYDSVDLKKIVSEILEDENYNQNGLTTAKMVGVITCNYGYYYPYFQIGGAA